jgi:nucleosome binding factor SPN SPT16 subunit
MEKYFKSKMEALIDRGTEITHEAFSQLVEEKIGNDDKPADMKLWNKNPKLANVDFTNTDWVYSPIIQSGGEYDLRVSAYSNENHLKPGVILSSLGVRYKSYCASSARTFMINPSKVSNGMLQNSDGIAEAGEQLLHPPGRAPGDHQDVQGGRHRQRALQHGPRCLPGTRPWRALPQEHRLRLRSRVP